MPWHTNYTTASVNIGDTVRLGAIFIQPSGTTVSVHRAVNSTVTPIWQARINDSDTITMQGNFTARVGLVGAYRANFVVSNANGFNAGDYVEIIASGRFPAEVIDFGIVRAFVVNDIYNANIVKVSGVLLSGARVDANVIAVGGSGISTPSVVNANLVQIGGSGVNLIDSVPANVTQFSGVPIATSTYIEDEVWNSQINQHVNNGTFGSGVNALVQDIYYADIKVVNNATAPNNEYGVTWFKNVFVVPSANIVDPALSVFSTINGAALFSNKVMTFSSTQLGSLSYIEPTNMMVSGVPYLVIASGLINGTGQVWQSVKGLDYM